MSNVPAKMTTKSLFQNVNVQKRFEELLGKKAQGFITSVMQVVGQNKLLAKADPQTVLTAAATAAALDLPINPNLGFAYIIPYNNNEKQPDGSWAKRTVAQFQMGYKGFIQLAQRSGQYRTINALVVYQNQFKGWDALSEELSADFTVKGDGDVVGYAATFTLTNGFKKTAYWSYEEVHAHAQKFSKSYTNKKGLWQDKNGGADAMGTKTVLKMILSKYGPLEIESQISRAISADQSVQKEEGQYQYIDNPNNDNAIDTEAIDMDKERKRVADHIDNAKTTTELRQVEGLIEEHNLVNEYDNRLLTLEAATK